MRMIVMQFKSSLSLLIRVYTYLATLFFQVYTEKHFKKFVSLKVAILILFSESFYVCHLSENSQFKTISTPEKYFRVVDSAFMLCH